MSTTWDHPELGRFTYDDEAGEWRATVDVPAFRAFSHDTGFENARRSTGKHDLVFEAEDEDEVPSPEMIELALRVLANQSELVPMVTKALWDDFNGLTPTSGMWWHGQVQRIAEEVGEGVTLSAPDDLLGALQVNSISVHPRLDAHDGPVVVLNFHAPFEEEHGVGVVTDGRKALGVGHSGG